MIAEGRTNVDGRVGLLADGALEAATYRMTFDTGTYLSSTEQPVFYPEVHVMFRVMAPSEHHHIPLLLSPFGYSTYRGS